MKHLVAIMLLCAAAVSAFGETQTWHLGKGQTWKQVPNDEYGRYLLAVSNVKQLINNGDAADAQQALAQLKKDFPGIAGPDLDLFIAGEVLYAQGKFIKSIPAFDEFMDKYPTSALYDAALDRQYQMGIALLDGYKVPLLKIFRVKGYEEGVKTMEKLADRAGNAPVAQQSLIAVAKHYEKRIKFREAYDTWADISSRWPTGELGKEALLNMARDMHSSYKGPRYDASGLATARGYYLTYKLRYPADAEAIGVDKIIANIEEKMAYKNYSIANYYKKTGSKTAANLYYGDVVQNWPVTTAGKMSSLNLKK